MRQQHLNGCGDEMDAHTNEVELRRLMVATLDGDADAHHSLLTSLSGRLRAHFRARLSRINRGLVEAEDLVQEVLIAVHTRRHTYDPSQPFTPWLYAIARYKFLDYLRRTKVSTQLPSDDAAELMTRHDFEGVESALDLEKLMAGLSTRTRQLIRDVKLDGLSVSQAAARSGMSQSAVKVAVHRGLKTLARLMRKGNQP